MTFSFAVSGSPESCIKQLSDNFAQAQRSEHAAAEAEGLDEYFDSAHKRSAALLDGAPDAHHSLSITGDAHTGYFSLSYNQPAQRA